MERRNLCSNNLKQHNMNQIYGYNKIKDYSSLNYENEYNNHGGDLGFSWPPRSYTCSFCKREFRSAQALGGHMNVHRRDRARLRQSPPLPSFHGNNPNHNNHGQFSLLNLNLDPNPSSSPSFFPSSVPTFSSILTKFPQFTSNFTPICPKTGNATEIKRWGENIDGRVHSFKPMTKDLINMKGSKGFSGVENFDRSMHEKGEYVGLDLEIGAISQSKEELDLELRLGYL